MPGRSARPCKNLPFVESFSQRNLLKPMLFLRGACFSNVPNLAEPSCCLFFEAWLKRGGTPHIVSKVRANMAKHRENSVPHRIQATLGASDPGWECFSERGRGGKWSRPCRATPSLDMTSSDGRCVFLPWIGEPAFMLLSGRVRRPPQQRGHSFGSSEA